MRVIRLGIEGFTDVCEAANTLWERPVIEKIIHNYRNSIQTISDDRFLDSDIGTLNIEPYL
jgi:hypothetical protein